MKKIICPNCGNELICDDVYDMDTYDNNTWIGKCCGHCEYCNTNWVWQEDFIFKNAHDFEQEGI